MSVMRRRAYASVGVRGVVVGVGGLCILAYLLYSCSSKVKLRKCECGREVQTEDRVKKLLPSLTAEIDPTTNRTVLEETEAAHPSLALGFLLRQEKRGARCHATPGVFSVRHRNILWQEAIIGSSVFHIYGAYYDHRDEGDGPTVRILTMVDSPYPPTPVCHLWFENDIAPTASTATRIDYIHWQDVKHGAWLPYLITCPSGGGPGGAAPSVAALAASPCAPATNALRVFQQHDTLGKKDLALCHKFLFDPTRDYSKRLVEWVEAARAWGVDEVTFYDAGTHPNVNAVLKYYKEEGFVRVFPWTSPGDQPSLPHIYRALYDTQRLSLFTAENIPYTDCLLRHIATHRYVAVWDMDEFLIPAQLNSLPAMMDAARARAASQGLIPTSYLALCSYYFDDQVEEVSEDLPQYVHMLRHVTRTVKLSPPTVFTKSVHDTSLALGLHAHFALLKLGGAINRARDLYHLYPSSEGHLGHYRATCQSDQKQCQELFRPFLTRDTVMWKHKNAIVARVTEVLKTLSLIP